MRVQALLDVSQVRKSVAAMVRVKAMSQRVVPKIVLAVAEVVLVAAEEPVAAGHRH